jgi:hypothetical protein
LERNSYTKAELNTYDKYLDIILTTRTYYVDALAEGRAETIRYLVITGNKNGLSIEQIQAYFHLDRKRIEEILIDRDIANNYNERKNG